MDKIEYTQNFLTQNELEYIRKAEPNAEQVAQRLEAKLSQNKRAVVIIQPGLEIPLELDHFISLLSRRNIVLVLETTSQAVYERSTTTYGPGASNPVLQLKVGRIGGEDCIKYVRERLGTFDVHAKVVHIPDAIIQRFTAARTARTDGLSIREFERICAYLFTVAMKRDNKVAAYEDIAEYYFSYARLT
jgi:hypothetical protein